MLITRKSRRRSELFRSRFREGSVDFPIRQYLRCREELVSGIIHAVLLAAFFVALIYFGKTLWNLFEAHGAQISPWYRRTAMFGLSIAILFVAIRLWIKVRNIRDVRSEMIELKSQFPNAPERPGNSPR